VLEGRARPWIPKNKGKKKRKIHLIPCVKAI
jgi:hypothetical protein